MQEDSLPSEPPGKPLCPLRPVPKLICAVGGGMPAVSALRSEATAWRLGREVAGRNWPSPWSTHCLGAQGSVLWKGLWFSYTTEDAVMNHFVWLLHEDPQIPKAWHSDSCRLLLQGKPLHLFQAHQEENGKYRGFCNQALAEPCWRQAQTRTMAE